jgi:CRP-like cAMP-binding protein
MKEYLKKLNFLTEEELDLLDGNMTTRTLAKGDFLIREGKICDELVYIKSGILRSFYLTDEGEEITYCLSFAENLMTALSSLITQKPTVESIQAISPTELIVVKKKHLDHLFEQKTNWLRLGKYLTEMQYVELENRIFGYQKYAAKKRYEQLLQRQPQHSKLIPAQYLASFLNITPRHFSRLRRELDHELRRTNVLF